MSRVIGSVEEQLLLEEMKEKEGINKAVRELHKLATKGEFGDTMFGRILLKLGYDAYVDKLEEYKGAGLNSHRVKTRNFLLVITEDMRTVAYITLLECINSAILKKSLTYTATTIVSRLRDVYLFEKLQRDNPKLHTYLGERFRKASKKDKRKLIKKHIEKLYKLGDTWEDKSLMVQLGTTLINILELSGANIVEVVKERVTVKGTNRYRNNIILTQDAQEVLTNLEYSVENMSSINKLPMIVPPKDWSNNYDGGFLRGKNFLFTTKSADVSKHLKAHNYPKLYPIINKLQQTGWRVNIGMLEVISTVFQDNMIDPKSPDKAPYLYGEIPTNQPYTADDFINQDMYEKWQDYNKEREEINIRASAETSKRLELVYTLSVAEQMKKYEALYFPYIFDYRGRVYSDVNFLTPQGQSYTKSLLELSEGRYLDKTGVFWLQVHIANVYGKDKLEYDGRIEWFTLNHDLIKRVGKDPMSNLADWVWCDSPFEFVAGCMAWVDHIEDRKVHLAIQLDATCSGIQMYSGLLRDRKGAESVNVIGDIRQDIYQIVADKVNNYLAEGKYPKWIEYKDKEGVEKSVYTEAIAKSMIGKITRSIVKRNVMTVPYSVTRKGMSNQLWDKIDEAILKGKEFWEGDKWVANKLLTTLNHTAIYDTIDGAKQGQEYLVELSRALDEPAQWKGVLYDFPLKQTSLELKESRVSTIYGKLVLNVEVPKLNKRRQSNSIAPNFVHNIDSTILIYCIDKMETQIGVIHDCFLVHPNDGDDIQDCYKEGFIEVMKADPLRNIQHQLDPEKEIEFPTYGDLNLEEVRDSKYIIS